MGFPLLLTQINLRRAEGPPLSRVDFSSVRVDLFLRDCGPVFPCRWTSWSEICMQNTDRIKKLLAPYKAKGFHAFYNSSVNTKYKAGTLVLTREIPLDQTISFAGDPLAGEGRVITIELEDYYVVNVYAPAASSYARLKVKINWWIQFCSYLQNLQRKKDIIICGDLNAVSTKQDVGLILPTSPGLYTEERQMIRDLTSQFQLTDSFRYMNPDSCSLSWVRNHDRPNVGLRIDYIFVPQSFRTQINRCIIDDRLFISDHYPVVLELEKHT